MYPYFALLVIPGLLQIWLETKHIVMRLNKKVITGKNIALPTFFVLFLLLLAVRNETVGRDLKTYKYIFNTIGQAEFLSIFSRLQEWVSRFYFWFIYNFVSNNYQVFLAITAALTVIPIAYVYNQDKSFGYMKIAVFVNMATFIMLFSGLRQGLAMAVGMLAYDAIKNKKQWLFLLWTLLAVFIHHTGFMILFMLPLYHTRFRKRDLIWLVPLVSLVFIYNRQIFNILSSFASEFSEDYGAQAKDTGAFGSFLLFTLFAIFCYLISDEQEMNEEAFGLRNILVFSVTIQSFAAVNPLAMRMNYYFILLIPLALGKSLQFSKSGYNQLAKIGELVISIFFTLYFFYGTYRSYVTGVSTLDTIPYIPFWKG